MSPTIANGRQLWATRLVRRGVYSHGESVSEMNNPLIFLSHSGEDTPFARELAQLLRPAGVDVWLDVERLQPGDRWGQKIEDGLRQATAMVLYVGKSGVRHWVDQEVR